MKRFSEKIMLNQKASAMTIHPHLIALWWDELIPVQCPRP